MGRHQGYTRHFRNGVMTAFLLISAMGCSREPDSVTAVPPALAVAHAPVDPALDRPADSPSDPDETIPHSDGLSAAAGLPLPLRVPLADDLQINFEYGTLLEFTQDPKTEERQVSIEPIDTPVDVAMDSLGASLKRAGFEPAASGSEIEPLHRLYRSTAQPPGLEIELLASIYAEPELAAHPGGTGSVAIHLRPIKGTD